MPEESPLVPRRSYPPRSRSSSSLKDVLLGERVVPRVSGEMKPRSLGKDIRKKKTRRGVNPFEAGKRRLISMLAGRRGGLVDKGVEYMDRRYAKTELKPRNRAYKSPRSLGVKLKTAGVEKIWYFEDDPPGGLTAKEKRNLWNKHSDPDGINEFVYNMLLKKTMPDEYWAYRKKKDEQFWKSPEGKKFAEEMKRDSTPEELAKRAKHFTEHAKKLEESGDSPFADTRLMLGAGGAEGLFTGSLGKYTPPHTRGAATDYRTGKPLPEQLETTQDVTGRETLYRSEKAASLKKMWEGHRHKFPPFAVPGRPGYESYYDKGELKYRKVKKGEDLSVHSKANSLPVGGWRPRYKSPYSKPRSK